MRKPESTERRFVPSASEKVPEIVLHLVDHLDAMVAFWDVNQVCVFANDAFRVWFGKTKEEVVGLTMEQLLGPRYVKNLPYIKGALAGDRQVFEREIPIPGGGIRYSLKTYLPYVVDGNVRGFFSHVTDVTPLKLLEHELRAAKSKAEFQATHDFLTGLPNRVLLMDRIAQGLAQARRRGHMVAVVSLDLDGFKSVNDGHGHGAGDQLLVEVSARILKSLRESDTVARTGGDEFVLVVTEIQSLSGIQAVANRILENVRRPFDATDARILPRASLGISIFPQHGATPEELILISDAALYAAKNAGRDRVVIWDLDAPPPRPDVT